MLSHMRAIYRTIAAEPVCHVRESVPGFCCVAENSCCRMVTSAMYYMRHKDHFCTKTKKNQNATLDRPSHGKPRDELLLASRPVVIPSTPYADSFLVNRPCLSAA